MKPEFDEEDKESMDELNDMRLKRRKLSQIRQSEGPSSKEREGKRN